MIFVRYKATTRQYKVYDLVNNKLIRSLNVMFFKNKRFRFKWLDEDQFGGELDDPFDPFEVLAGDPLPQVEVNPVPEQLSLKAKVNLLLRQLNVDAPELGPAVREENTLEPEEEVLEEGELDIR
jgi:hypothetical protein